MSHRPPPAQPRAMKRLICWLDGFIETWFDPGMWRLHLSGLHVTAVGHVFDFEHPRYEVEGDREHRFYRCVRCGAEHYEGWHRFYGVPTAEDYDC